jgi:hypothetical protein
MRSVSAAWKWFGLGSLISCALSAIGTFHLVSNRLSQIGDDPALALPPIMVAATSAMTFFGLLIPMLMLLGLVVVLIDGLTRRKPS